mgnify:FL=1
MQYIVDIGGREIIVGKENNVWSSAGTGKDQLPLESIMKVPSELISPESKELFSTLPKSFTSNVTIKKHGIDIRKGNTYILSTEKSRRYGTTIINYTSTDGSGN